MEKEIKHWNVLDDRDIFEMLIFISERYYGDGCSKCSTSCCTDQALEIYKDEVKQMAKHLKMDDQAFRNKYTLVKKNFMKGAKVKEMSKAAEAVFNRPGRFVRFIDVEQTIRPDGKKHVTTVCPFYDKDTHRCKVHEVRPGACVDYPFQVVDKDAMEVRKVTECVITDTFLERFLAFVETLPGENSKDYAEKTRKVLLKKEYINHFYVPWKPVLFYLSHEFETHGVEKLAYDILKRIEAEDRAEEKGLTKDKK